MDPGSGDNRRACSVGRSHGSTSLCWPQRSPSTPLLVVEHEGAPYHHYSVVRATDPASVIANWASGYYRLTLRPVDTVGSAGAGFKPARLPSCQRLRRRSDRQVCHGARSEGLRWHFLPSPLAGCEGSEPTTLGPDAARPGHRHLHPCGLRRLLSGAQRRRPRFDQGSGPLFRVARKEKCRVGANACRRSACFPDGRRLSIVMRTSRGGASPSRLTLSTCAPCLARATAASTTASRRFA